MIHKEQECSNKDLLHTLLISIASQNIQEIKKKKESTTSVFPCIFQLAIGINIVFVYSLFSVSPVLLFTILINTFQLWEIR